MKKIYLSFTVILGFLAFSCDKSSPAPETNSTATKVDTVNKAVNNWIYSEMKDYYLWTDKIKPESQTDITLKPEDYFYSLLFKPDTVDRFSWIQESVTELTNSLNGKSTSLGIRTQPFYADAGRSKVTLAILFVLKGSAAEAAGLKRGDFINKVNGAEITVNNYSTALAPENLKLTLGKYTQNGIEDSDTEISATKTELTLNPIQADTIIEIGNKKIGYLAYIQFLTSADGQMKNVFKKFKEAGVNELVLDLRFNGGGYITSSDLLSSLIVPAGNAGKLMNRKAYNASLTDALLNAYGSNYLKTNFSLQENNLGNLTTLYVLTSTGTASASELVINNLKPYMNVVLIGNHTYGKNVGSFTISDEKNRWDWGMQPITLITYNAEGKSDYGTKDGFLPDYEVSDNALPFLPLGDKNETLLSKAIEVITGSAPQATSRSLRRSLVSSPSNVQFFDNPKMELKDMFDKNPLEK